MNAAAALGYGVVLYGLAVIIALLGVRAARVSRRAARRGSGVRRHRCPAGVFVAALHEDRQVYERAADLQREALATLEGVGRPAEGTTIYLFGVAGEISPNVFTFVRSNDLSPAPPAVERRLDHGRARRAPRRPGPATRRRTPASGDATGVQPRGWLYEDHSATPYGTARFVDVRTRASETIRQSAGV